MAEEALQQTNQDKVVDGYKEGYKDTGNDNVDFSSMFDEVPDDPNKFELGTGEETLLEEPESVKKKPPEQLGVKGGPEVGKAEKPAEENPNVLKDPPEGFRGSFFKKDESGTSFDREAFSKFVNPDGVGRETKYPDSRRQYAPEKNVEPELPIRERLAKEYREQAEERNSIIGRHVDPLLSFQKYYESGQYSLQDAFALAQKDATEKANKAVSEYDIGLRAKEEAARQESASDPYEGNKQKERINVSRAVSELRNTLGLDNEKGYEKFFDLMKYLAPDIDMLYDVANPGELGKRSAKDRGEAVDKWMTNSILSNEENFQWFWGLAKQRLSYSMQPFMSDAMFQGLKKNTNVSDIPGAGGPSPVNNPPPGVDTDSSWVDKLG